MTANSAWAKHESPLSCYFVFLCFASFSAFYFSLFFLFVICFLFFVLAVRFLFFSLVNASSLRAYERKGAVRRKQGPRTDKDSRPHPPLAPRAPLSRGIKKKATEMDEGAGGQIKGDLFRTATTRLSSVYIVLFIPWPPFLPRPSALFDTASVARISSGALLYRFSFGSFQPFTAIQGCFLSFFLKS